MKPKNTAWQRLGKKSVFFGAALSLVLAGCSTAAQDDSASSGGLEDMDPVTFKISTMYGPDNFQTAPMNAYTEAVKEASGGKIDFEIYYAGSLVPAGELAAGLTDGIIDMAHVAMAYTPSAFPIDTWITKMGFVSDKSPVAGALQGGAATLDWAINNDEYIAEFTDQGLVPLLPRIQVLHKYNMLCKAEATSLADMQGKRTRVGGEAWAKEAENIGAVPVSMPGTEVYTSFQQGLLDCFLGSLEDVSALGLADHADNFVTTGMTSWTSAALLMSEDAWNGLPLEAQQLMWDKLPVYLETLYATNFALNTQIITDGLNVKFLKPESDLQKKIDDYHAGLPAALAAEAPAGISDAKGTLAEYAAVNEKWWGIITGDLGISGEPADWGQYLDEFGTEPLDLTAWSERVYNDILKPHRPE